MRALFTLLIAASTFAGAPARKAKGTEPVLLVALNGAASPVACLRDGHLEAGVKCKDRLRSRQVLRTPSGPLASETWEPHGSMCPWSAGPDDDARLQLGALRLCRAHEDCTETPAQPQLAVWPASSAVRFAKLHALDPKAGVRQEELPILAALVGADPKSVQAGDAFELDLNADGRLDRVVQLTQPSPSRHELGPRVWTFILVDGAEPRKLGQEGCMEQFLGAVDLDGDGAMEVVMLFQYQVVLFHLDGSVAVENAECCGLG